jgi:hypothetical protein
VDPETDRIDFISAYCDRWCERCAFTSRCSAYAVEIAEGMCGDASAALELALGVAPPVREAVQSSASRSWIADCDPADVSDSEIEIEIQRHEARREQAAASPVAQLASACSRVAWRWLHARHDLESPSADPVVTEAFEIAARDAHFIAAKLMRALQGRLDFDAGESFADDPVQNDWNGSAKVALISIERSALAWQVIADATREDTPRALATQLADLARLVQTEFPAVRQFVRPGFDEPGR